MKPGGEVEAEEEGGGGDKGRERWDINSQDGMLRAERRGDGVMVQDQRGLCGILLQRGYKAAVYFRNIFHIDSPRVPSKCNNRCVCQHL